MRETETDLFSGPALGVVAGSRLPSYCVMSRTALIARKLMKLGDGMKIHISEDSKNLLDTVGGFRCDDRGTLEFGVTLYWEIINNTIKYFLKTGKKMDTFWLIGPDPLSDG